jgi:tetratricopeptide (TPR) repeat protein
MKAKANDSRSAEKALMEAYGLADGSRHDEVRAEVATSLVFVVGKQEGRLGDALRWSETATAVLQRLGGHELLRAWLVNNLGCAYATDQKNDLAVAALQQGSLLKQKLVGSDNTDVGLSEGNLGSVLQGMRRNEEALSHTERAVAIFEKTLGLQHPQLAYQLDTRGEILNALGRYQSARDSFARALSIWEREFGRDAGILAYALTGIGLSYLGEASPSNAIVPLERALALRSGHDTPASERAETSFALAQSLWQTGREMGRARNLAEQARASYAQAAMEKDVASVDAWLRNHGSS